MHGIDAHYQCDVRKETSMQYREWSSGITNHFYRANSRVNIGSTDNSSNFNNFQSDKRFDEIRAAIRSCITSWNESGKLLELVDELEETKGTPSFNDKYKSFMELAANHIGVISPWIPALSQLLSSN